MTKQLLLAVLILIASQSHAQPTPLPKSKNDFIVIAHRGNHTRVPENTLASIYEAIRAGADYVEIDLRSTKDKRLVLHHDATVDRMTNGKGNVKDLSLEELLQLQVTSPVKSTKKTFHIAQFHEVLKACKKRINIYLDFKEADVEQTWREIIKAGMEKQVIVYLNKEDQYKQWRKTAPLMPLMTSLPDAVSTPEKLSSFLGKVEIAAMDNIHDSAMAAVARGSGVSIWLDVESDNETPAIWEEALSKNIQGVQTDHPEELIVYLKRKNLRNGPAR